MDLSTLLVSYGKLSREAPDASSALDIVQGKNCISLGACRDQSWTASEINLQLNRPVIAGLLMLRAIKFHETNFLEDIWTEENWQKQENLRRQKFCPYQDT
jgi:hypothetical protein